MWLLCLLTILSALPAPTAITPGFDHFYNLEYDEALRQFRADAARDASDPAALNHIAHAILYREMYRTGALESELVSGANAFLRRERVNPSAADVEEFESAIRRSMELCQQRLSADAKDSDALYALGVAYGLRGNYNFLVRKAWLDALRDATTARKLHDKVVALKPSFIDARLLDGVHDYVVGSLPFAWKMLGFVAGFRGDKNNGIRTLQTVAREGDINRTDAEVLLAAVYRRERRSKDAIPLLEDLIRRFPRNYLFRLELAYMHGDLGQRTQALAVIDEVERLQRKHAPGYSRLLLEKVLYARGNLLFWFDDYDRAIDNLRRAAARANELDLNTAMLCWLRLGQCYDLKGAREQARTAYNQAIAIAPKSDLGREADRYRSAPYRRPRS